MLPRTRGQWLGLGLVALAVPAWGQAAAPAADPSSPPALIEAIQFRGNKVTRPQILLQEMVIHPGDPADPARIEASRQAIMNLGLFKAVAARLLPGQTGQVLEIDVDERYFLLPIPRLDRNSDGDISYGIELRVDNLLGLNQRIRIIHRNTDASDGGSDSRQLSVAYDYPRFAGSPYGFGISANMNDSTEAVEQGGTVVANYDTRFIGVQARLRRWLTHEGPSAGWSVNGGPFWKRRDYALINGTPGLRDAERAAGLDGSIDYQRVQEYLFSRHGTEYGFEVEWGMPGLGSDSTYGVHQFYYRRYYRFDPRSHQAWNTHLRLGFAGGDPPLAEAAFSLGGSGNLRGYPRGSAEGQSFFVLNSEFHQPLTRRGDLRAVLFADIGNAYPDKRMIDPGDLEAGAGTGLRYTLESFVDVQLRLDYAVGLGGGERKFYFGTRSTF